MKTHTSICTLVGGKLDWTLVKSQLDVSHDINIKLFITP